MSKKKFWKKIGNSVCAAICAALFFAGCGEREEPPIVLVEPEEIDVTYLFAVVEPGDVIKTEKINATYRQMKEQEVSFALSGKAVEHVYVKEGQTVKKGELLAELSGGDLDRKVEELEYRIARNELLLGYTEDEEQIQISGQWVNYLYLSGQWGGEERIKEDVKNIQNRFAETRADYEEAIELDRMELESIKKEIRESRVYASMDGVIYKLADNLEGSTSKKDKVVMRVIDTAECLFETKAPEFAGYFKEGEPVEMKLVFSGAAGEYLLMPYHIEEWGETQLFSVYEGPENDGIEVGAGGTISLVTEKRENVLQIPSDIVNKADGRSFVYVLGADNLREMKWVETGLYGNDNVEIISGLEEGEKVIRK